jgi:hypothetical protein
MPTRAACALFFLTLGLRGQALPGQTPLPIAEPLKSLAAAAAVFAKTAPGLMADETLDQRGRRGFAQILQGTLEKPKSVNIRLPQGFREHHVISSYGFARMGEGNSIHELRRVISIDGRILRDAGEARHAMSMGVLAADDHTKRQLLENFEREQLEGAITDFGQLILLFTARSQPDYAFSYADPSALGGEPALVIAYHQISGQQGLTVFEARSGERENTSGEIWFRSRDLLPLRITMNTEKPASKKDVIRMEATVEYASGPFGLLPSSVTQRQLFNALLLVENDLHYTDFKKP